MPLHIHLLLLKYEEDANRSYITEIPYMQELRFINYGINCSLVGLSMLLAASQLIHPSSALTGQGLLAVLKNLLQQGSDLYEYTVDVHPIATKVSLRNISIACAELHKLLLQASMQT